MNINYIKNGCIFRAKVFWNSCNKFFYKQPTVLSTLESLKSLIHTGNSLSRYGDGEFKIMRGGNLGFQKHNKELADRLSNILKNPVEGHSIGLPDVFGSLKEYDKQSAKFWKAYLATNRRYILKNINISRTYLNTNMTRFWSGYKRDLKLCSTVIQAYKELWDNKEVIFVEGKKTRMGVGNDLFSNAKSVHRILCPAENAWNGYEKILSTVKTIAREHPDLLYILALGPTATVLAYDLAKLGIRALDLGHIDIQYEYYLKRSKGKTAIRGKYVNESTDGRQVDDSIIDNAYKESIIALIKQKEND